MHIYKTKENKRVPSVTTITGLYGEKDGLLHWANGKGLEGITLSEAREAVATPGSMAHDMVDKFIRGEPWDQTEWRHKFSTTDAYNEAVKRCSQAFANFERWASYSKFQLVEGEIPLVSEEFKFGGRLDAIMTEHGLALADWKTGGSGGIFADYLYQVAGYAILWEENFPDQPITNGYHIIRFNRDTADFAHWHFSELEDAREGFLRLRELYEIHKKVQKRVK